MFGAIPVKLEPAPVPAGTSQPRPRESATLVGTGGFVFQPVTGRSENNPKAWYVEYLCNVHSGIIHRWDTDMNELIREVLRDNGIAEQSPSG